MFLSDAKRTYLLNIHPILSSPHHANPGSFGFTIHPIIRSAERGFKSGNAGNVSLILLWA